MEILIAQISTSFVSIFIFFTYCYVYRLGILVDFLSHATITGFMGGTATLICLQQLKGIFGLKHFTTHTSIVDVLQAIFSHTNEVCAHKISIQSSTISTIWSSSSCIINSSLRLKEIALLWDNLMNQIIHQCS